MQTSICFSPLDLLWAKSSAQGGLPLRLHLLDVASVCVEVLSRMPASDLADWTERLGLPGRVSALQWIPLLVSLHDLGKATPGFQAKWREGAARSKAAGFSYPLGAPDRHDAATKALLPVQLTRLGVPRSASRFLADAVAAHHGFKVSEMEANLFDPIDAPLAREWSEAQALLLDELINSLGPLQPASPRFLNQDRGPVWTWLAGLCSFCDWIGSSEAYFSHDRPHTSSSAWFESSRGLARKALAAIGSPAHTSTGPIVDEVRPEEALALALPGGRAPRPLQRAVASLIEPSSGPSLVLIEASMGEGKTEAAFAAHARLGHRGLYVAMPTQATSNALYGRVAAFLARLEGEGQTLLQLLHAGARHDDVQLRLRDVGFGTQDATVQVSSWFVGSRRGLLAENAVGTVDQALISVLHAKHAFVRMFGLADRLIVLDEVHAYDDYTGGLIERLVAWLAAMRCSVVVMSATLPAAKREALVRAWSPTAVAPSTPYPRVTVVDAAGVRSATFEAARRYRVEVRSAPADARGIAALTAELLAEGGCALLVVNTVARAQEVYVALKQHPDVEPLLFHARFPFEERLTREGVALERFGPEGKARDRVVLVATQVVEQSLDVDFDVLVSDLAPIDLLLQRIGRLHRHFRVRPGSLSEPRVYVSGLSESGVPAPESRKVYDAWPVLRTVVLLRRRSVLALPEDIDSLVQQVYGPDPMRTDDSALHDALDQAEDRYLNEKTRQSDLAAQSAQPVPDEWSVGHQSVPLDDSEAEVAGLTGSTRLGDPSMLVVPFLDLGDEWGVGLGVMDRWRKSEAVTSLIASRLASRYLRLRRWDALNAGAGSVFPEGWSRHPSLARLSPLVLNAEGRCSGDRVSLMLDAELGLIIERLPQ